MVSKFNNMKLMAINIK